MSFSPSAFSRLLEPLNRRDLDRCVAAHGGNHGVSAEGWTCQRHLKTMLFAQFAGLGSLREIDQALSGQPRALYHLGLLAPRRSTLSDALAKRPAEVFRDVAVALIGQASRQLRGGANALVQLIDASPIPLRDLRFTWAEQESRVRGLKLHIGYDPRTDMPDWAEITSAKVSDITVGRTISIDPGTTYVFDKGYLDFGWWQRIDAAGAVFVSRLKRNTKVRSREPNTPIGDGILSDTTVRIGQTIPRGRARNPLQGTDLREITVEREGKTPLTLITNDHDRPASEIAALYKERWQIELLFKWIKQNLKIKSFLGRSENAVKAQIYAALIAYLLLRLLRQTAASMHKGSPKTLIARLKIALMTALDFSANPKPPPQHPRNRPPAPQLYLDLRCTA